MQRSASLVLSVSVIALAGCVDDSTACRPDPNAPTPRVVVTTSEGILAFSVEQPSFGTDRDVTCYPMPGVTLTDSSFNCRMVFMAAPASVEESVFMVDEVFLDASVGCPGLPADVVGVYTLAAPTDTFIEVPTPAYKLEDQTFRRACVDEGPILHFGGGMFRLDGGPIDGVLSGFLIFEFEHRFAGPIRVGTGGQSCP